MAQVVIVGAGPAGAALAFLLARRGIHTTLLERHSDFAREFRGEVLMPSGLDALAQMGLAAEVERLPRSDFRAIELYYRSRRLARATPPAGLQGQALPTWLPQPALLEMLVAEAEKTGAFRLERGATARDLVRENGRVVGVRAQTPTGEREFRGDLVVGADGRASTVRKRAEIPVAHAWVAIDVVWCRLPQPAFFDADPHFRFYFGGGHLALVAPVPGSEIQVGWVIRKGTYGDVRRRGIADWIDTLAAHVSPDLAAHLRAHRSAAVQPFLLDAVSDRVAHWTLPGLLLLGDAAHAMSPVVAQGINIALRDALVAANHLVPVLTGGGSPAEIDAASAAVETERLPEVAEIQRLQSFPQRVILSNSWWAGLVLRVVPRLMARDIGRGRGGALFRRIAFGVTEVKLRV
jgi:2-polyprenyl-6-methoxyphenol hydroxylase-like FAD-dependent oxidoreductase